MPFGMSEGSGDFDTVLSDTELDVEDVMSGTEGVSLTPGASLPTYAVAKYGRWLSGQLCCRPHHVLGNSMAEDAAGGSAIRT
jgi:hypothetical protein